MVWWEDAAVAGSSVAWGCGEEEAGARDAVWRRRRDVVWRRPRRGAVAPAGGGGMRCVEEAAGEMRCEGGGGVR